MPQQRKSVQRSRTTPAKRRGSSARTRRPAGHVRHAAAAEAAHRGRVEVNLPWVGEVELPPPDHLAWYVGVGVLAAAELIDWPVAVALAIGKVLADNRHSRALEEFGEALDEVG